jgi:hypothetical protein
MFRELRLVVCFQDGTHDFLQQLVGPGRDAERSCFPRLFWFGDMRPSDWRPAVSLEAQGFDDLVDFRQGHPVHGLRCRAPGHGPVVTVDAAIGPKVESRLEELPVDVLQRQSSLASVADDVENVFGGSHPECLRVLFVRSPTPLRHVDGFPALGLLWGFCRPRARAP